MIVAIDGPAGAGKSSVSRALAQRLGFQFLDTGAMYRAVAWAAIDVNHDWNDAAGLARLARSLDLEIGDQQVLVNGRDVTAAIRTLPVTSAIHYAADNAEVRSHLVALQRKIGAGRDLVTEGRDQSTVAFPNAECKIFLTASPQVRAERRLAELASQGQTTTLAEVLAQQTERDRRDAARPVGALVKASEAIEVVTDGLTSEQVVDRLEAIVRENQARRNL